MSLIGKNKHIFSYSNKNETGKKYINKDFEKTSSYHTNFSTTLFENTSFRAAKIKYCNFYGSLFKSSEFIGTNLKGCKFKNATFENCVLTSANIKKATFKDASFHHCFITGINKDCFKGAIFYNCIFYDKYPSLINISSSLRKVIEELRSNDIIRRSHTLHLKNGKINTLTILILRELYDEIELIHLLPLIPNYLTTQFYTTSYLIHLLKKIQNSV